MKTRGLHAALAAGPRLVRPATIRGAIETLRYKGGDIDAAVEAELLSMAVTARARGAGFGVGLGERFLRRCRERGVSQVRVVVGSDNTTAIGLYRRLGFADATTIEVHAGKSSELLVWRAQALPS